MDSTAIERATAAEAAAAELPASDATARVLYELARLVLELSRTVAELEAEARRDDASLSARSERPL